MGAAMPQFTPELIRDMRKALEDAMTRVPVEYTTAAVKVYLAECILRAAAQGHTSYNEFFPPQLIKFAEPRVSVLTAIPAKVAFKLAPPEKFL